MPLIQSPHIPTAHSKPWTVQFCAGQHAAARPAALRTQPLPDMAHSPAMPPGVQLADALLDSSPSLEAGRLARDEVLATQPGDELSGSDAEATPRCAHGVEHWTTFPGVSWWCALEGCLRGTHSGPAPDKVLATQPDDELSGSDAEATPRWADEAVNSPQCSSGLNIQEGK